MDDLKRRVKEWKEISRPDFIGTHELIDDLLKAATEAVQPHKGEAKPAREHIVQQPSTVWQRVDDAAKTGEQLHLWIREKGGVDKTIISRWLEKEERWVKCSKDTEVIGYQLFPQPIKKDE